MLPRRHKAPRILTVAFGVLLLLAPGCSSPNDIDPATGPTPSSSSGAVPEVLDFTAPRLGGGTVEGADFAGKDTAIWFWAPW